MLKNATELKGVELEGDEVSDLAGKIKDLIKGFIANMDSRKKKLNDAVRLHAIMDKV